MKKVLSLCLIILIKPCFSMASDENKEIQDLANPAFSLYQPMFNLYQSCDLTERIGTKVDTCSPEDERLYYQENSKYALVVYDPLPEFRYFNETLQYTQAVFPAVLKGTQKILESYRHTKVGALAGAGSCILNTLKHNISLDIPNNTSELIDSINKASTHQSFYPMIADLLQFAANSLLFLYEIPNDPNDLTRIEYSSLRLAAAAITSLSKCPTDLPETFYSIESLNFLRQGMFLILPLAYESLRHYGKYPAINVLIAMRVANHLLSLLGELYQQEEFIITSSLLQNFALSSVLSSQIFTYLYDSSYLSLSYLLSLEYLTSASFAYYKSL